MMTLWNVTVIKAGEKHFAAGYQFYAKDIMGAIKQAEKFGRVIKAVMASYEED